MVLSASLFAAIGAYWLLNDHPELRNEQIIEHILLPTIMAGILSIPLNVINIGVEWWVVFGLGCILIIFTLISEYYSIDPKNSLYTLAKIIIKLIKDEKLLEEMSRNIEKKAAELSWDFIGLMVHFI